MKLCTNCRHFMRATEQCAAAPKPDPVHGKAGYFSASIERTASDDGSCGMAARHFEPMTEREAT